MWKDPIVAKTRKLREEYASQFGHNADAIFQDVLRRQSVPSKTLVTFPPRNQWLPNKALQPTVLPPLRCGRTAAELERYVS